MFLINPYIFGQSADIEGAVTPTEIPVLFSGGNFSLIGRAAATSIPVQFSDSPSTFVGNATPTSIPVDLARTEYDIDQYATDLWAVWSPVSRLREAYTGALVRVRRSGDDAEQDFGRATGSERIDEAALEAWVIAGGGTQDGFVVTEYDQSGNANHRTQATASKQPLIVDAGVYIDCAYFERSRSCCLVTSNNMPSTTGRSIFHRGIWPDDATQSMIYETGIGGEATTNYWLRNASNVHGITMTGGGQAGYTSTIGDTTIHAAVWDRNEGAFNTENKLYANSTLLSATNLTNAVTSGSFSAQELHYGARNNGASLPADIKHRATVVYSAAKSAADVALITPVLRARVPNYAGP